MAQNVILLFIIILNLLRSMLTPTQPDSSRSWNSRPTSPSRVCVCVCVCVCVLGVWRARYHCHVNESIPCVCVCVCVLGVWTARYHCHVNESIPCVCVCVCVRCVRVCVCVCVCVSVCV